MKQCSKNTDLMLRCPGSPEQERAQLLVCVSTFSPGISTELRMHVCVCEVTEALTSLKIDLRSSHLFLRLAARSSSSSGSGTVVVGRVYHHLLGSLSTSCTLSSQTTAASHSLVNLIRRLYGYLWKLIKRRGASSLVHYRLSGSMQLYSYISPEILCTSRAGVAA